MEKEGLWYRVLKARYSEEGGRIKEGDRHLLVWWRAVFKVRDGVGEGVRNWFEENICWVVGDWSDTFFWYDKWIGDIPLRLNFPRLFELSVEKEYRVAHMGGSGGG